MSRNQSGTGRELRFVCPKCGSTWLQTRNESYINVDYVYDNGYCEWGSIKHEEIMDYLCGECGYVLVLDLENEEQLHEWLMTHCSQDESVVGQSEDLAPDGPPSESDK